MLDRMSRNDGGDVGLVAAEARGMSAMLGGLEAVMTESPSPSSKTEDGCGEVSRGDGLGVMRTGDCPRIRDLGILPVDCAAGGYGVGFSTTKTARLAMRRSLSRSVGKIGASFSPVPCYLITTRIGAILYKGPFGE